LNRSNLILNGFGRESFRAAAGLCFGTGFLSHNKNGVMKKNENEFPNLLQNMLIERSSEVVKPVNGQHLEEEEDEVTEDDLILGDEDDLEGDEDEYEIELEEDGDELDDEDFNDNDLIIDTDDEVVDDEDDDKEDTGL
jgi:hypothetical protein